jgi:sRNA-binding regulator protein Hfq
MARRVVIVTTSDWDDFLTLAVGVLEKALNGDSTHMNRASQFFEDSRIVEGELREFLVNSIWEMDANVEGFEEFLNFLKKKPTHAMLIDYMNQKI